MFYVSGYIKIKVMKERDNLHFNFREIDGYNKAINIVISEREPGKTTALWLDKFYYPWVKTGQTGLYPVRQIVEITDELITSIQNVSINKFLEKPIKFEYNISNAKSGMLDIFIEGKLFFRIISLSLPIRRLKLSLIPDIGVIAMDEYIIDPTTGEKYNEGEIKKIKEIYTTYKREKASDKPLKMYFLGNPYSLYNPLFMWLGVDSRKLKRGVILTGSQYVVQCYEMKPELREKILKENPLFEFDDAYKKYAFDGEAVNDSHIMTGKLPPNYSLKFSFYYRGKYIGVYEADYWIYHEEKYFCKFEDKISSMRTTYCFEFEELKNRTILMSSDERSKFSHFKIAMRQRRVEFEVIECYYLMRDIYSLL